MENQNQEKAARAIGRVAVIGCGIQMRCLEEQFLRADLGGKHVDVVVACDCDRVRAAYMAERVNRHAGKAICRAASTAKSLGRY